MSVNYRFTCDACGKTGEGVAGQYVHPDPPLGWTWRFGPGLEGPHACSAACWAKANRTQDGKGILPCTHDENAWAEAMKPRANPPPPTPAKPAKRKPGRPIKTGSVTDLTRRVEAIEGQLAGSGSASK